MNNRFSVNILLACIILCISASCKKERYDKVALEPWTPSLAVPLVDGTLSLADVVENINKSVINVTEDANGLYFFIYRDTLVSDYAETFIHIPDQSFQKTETITVTDAGKITTGISVHKSYSGIETFQTENGQALKYIDLKGGTLNLSLSSTFKADVQIDLTINSLTKNGVPYTTSFILPYNSSLPVSSVQTGDLKGYRIDLSGNGSQTNTFQYNAEAEITPKGNPATGTETVKFNIDFSNLKYHLIYGNIGTYSLPEYSGSVKIEIFQNATMGQVIFNDPKISFSLHNSFGIPSSFLVNKLETQADYGTIVPITSNGNLSIPGPNNINAPTTPGLSAQTDYALNASNSNIVDAFKPAPSKINYKITPSINSGGQTNNFILDTSNVKIYAEAVIPMDGSIKIYDMVDTVRNIKLPNKEFIDFVTFKIKTTNSLPIDVKLQGYWLDSLGNILDTLIVPPKDLIISGSVNSNGEITAPSVQYIEITYDAARYQRVKNAKMLMLKGNLNSSNQGNTMVKFFSFNKLQIQISALAKGNIQF